MRVYVEIDRKKCNMCKLCVEYCPVFVFVVRNGLLDADYSRCIECYGCVVLCPQGAISVKITRGGLHALFPKH